MSSMSVSVEWLNSLANDGLVYQPYYVILCLQSSDEWRR